MPFPMTAVSCSAESVKWGWKIEQVRQEFRQGVVKRQASCGGAIVIHLKAELFLIVIKILSGKKMLNLFSYEVIP